MRYLMLTIEEDGVEERIHVAKTPLREQDGPWRSVSFFAEYIIRCWREFFDGSR